jgi:hypothetical protein
MPNPRVSDIRARLGAPLFAILLAATLPAAMPAGAVRAADAPRIENPATPAGGVTTLRLEELWCAGGDDDEDLMFGLITRVRTDEEGNLYVMDAQLQQVHVLSPDGRLLRTLCREGDGPGEVRMGTDMAFLPDGSIGVARRYPGAIVRLDRQGHPAGPAIGGRTAELGFASLEVGGGNLVAGAVGRVAGEREMTNTTTFFLGSFDLEGTEKARYLASEWFVDYQNDFVFDEARAIADFAYSFAVDREGRVYAAADRDRYAISVFAPDGRLERVIEREFTPRRRTATELARMRALTDRRFRTFPFDITFDLCENEAVLAWYHRALQIAADGTLWVRHSRSGTDQPPGVMLTFDVFDPAGRFVRQVAVPDVGEALHDGVFLAGADRLVLVRGFVDSMRTHVGGGQGALADLGDEPAAPEIVCFAIR